MSNLDKDNLINLLEVNGLHGVMEAIVEWCDEFNDGETEEHRAIATRICNLLENVQE